MKKSVAILAVTLVAGLLLVACGGSEPTATPQPTPSPTEAPTATPEPAQPAGDVENGQKQFTAYCSACHGPAGEGVQGLGKDMTQSEFVAGLSDEELIAFIKVGRATDDPLNTTGVAMPPKGGNPAVDDATLVDIVAYMRSIHQ